LDKRKNNGGHSNGGRKSKSEEMQLVEKLGPLEPTALKALKDGVNTGEFVWVKLYMEYMYGKPKMILDVTTNGNDMNIPALSWANDKP